MSVHVSHCGYGVIDKANVLQGPTVDLQSIADISSTLDCLGRWYSVAGSSTI